jgi:hypothetical protein
VSGVARLNVNLPSELHGEAKVEAFYAGQTLAEFVTQAVRAHVEEAKRTRVAKEQRPTKGSKPN